MFINKEKLATIERSIKQIAETQSNIARKVGEALKDIEKLEDAANLERVKVDFGILNCSDYKIPVSDALESLILHLGVCIYKKDVPAQIVVDNLSKVKVNRPGGKKGKK